MKSLHERVVIRSDSEHGERQCLSLWLIPLTPQACDREWRTIGHADPPAYRLPRFVVRLEECPTRDQRKPQPIPRTTEAAPLADSLRSGVHRVEDLHGRRNVLARNHTKSRGVGTET